jgi:hypothetical protein
MSYLICRLFSGIPNLLSLRFSEIPNPAKRVRDRYSLHARIVSESLVPTYPTFLKLVEIPHPQERGFGTSEEASLGM